MTARRPPRDRGSATAELAVSLPALVLLVLVGMTAVGAVRTQLECVDAAREAARAAARGAPGVAAGQRVAPAGAEVTVTEQGDTVVATVRARVGPVGSWAPGFDVDATAVAAREPDASP
jgi:Flp pilus assembly protein TadG